MFMLNLWGQADSLSITQMALRGGVIFWVGYLLLRIGGWQIFGKKSAFDYVIIIIVGSVLSKIIIGDTAFFPATAACLVMVLFNRLISWLCARYKRISNILDGKPVLLYGNGRFYWQNLRRACVSYPEFMQSLRLEMHTENLQSIATAKLETSGRISFTRKLPN